MENLFIFLIVIIFILQWVAKLIQRARPQPEPEPEETLPSEIEEYFKSIGLPREEAKPSPPELTPEREVVKPPKEAEKKKVITPAEEIKKEEEPATLRALPLKKFPLSLSFSAETITQGIILSTILGPPKARRPRR